MQVAQEKALAFQDILALARKGWSVTIARNTRDRFVITMHSLRGQPQTFYGTEEDLYEFLRDFKEEA